MNIGWYPGHMHKARKDITKALRGSDAVIEIVDARLPWSSANPLLDSLIGDTPRLKVLNKADLADPAVTAQWLDWYRSQGQGHIVALDKGDTGRIRALAPQCQRAFRKADKKDFHLMIVGIPNVGKSTLMNILLDRKIAKVGNEPAVTRARQEIRLSEHIVLADTPGILWPKIEDQDAACRLAATGAIKNTAFEFADIAQWTAAFLAQHYPALLSARYRLEAADLALPAEALLEKIGARRGALVRGRVDLTRAGEILLHDLRGGKIGLISLEAPPPPPRAGQDGAAEQDEDGVDGMPRREPREEDPS